ncbi:hypothetical protein J6A31_05910 [bacterium]|nr:hypothetical protein [bacterium]
MTKLVMTIATVAIVSLTTISNAVATDAKAINDVTDSTNTVAVADTISDEIPECQPEWTGDYVTPVGTIADETITGEPAYNGADTTLTVATPDSEFAGVHTVNVRGDMTMETETARVIVSASNVAVYGYDGAIAVYDIADCTVTC